MSKRALAAALFLHTLLCSPAQAESVQDLQVLLKQGQFARVIERTDAQLASKPRDVQLRFLKGVALAELNRNADAIAVFQRLTEDYPDLPEPYNNLAVLYAQQKQYDKARAALETAIRTHPSYATAHENLGDIYARLASQAYDKALSLDASNSTAQNKLSMLREIMSTSPAGRTLPASPATASAAQAPRQAPAPQAVIATAPKPTPAATVAVQPSAPPALKEEPKPATKRSTNTMDEVSNQSAAVSKTVQAWATAWSRKDVKGYLAYYARDFEPPKGQNRKAWEDERSQRLSKPGEIDVQIEDLKVTSIDANRATVKLRQNYRSANLSSSSGKTLLLVWQDGKWLIQQERVGN